MGYKEPSHDSWVCLKGTWFSDKPIWDTLETTNFQAHPWTICAHNPFLQKALHVGIILLSPRSIHLEYSQSLPYKKLFGVLCKNRIYIYIHSTMGIWSMIPNIWPYPHISFMGEHGDHPFFCFENPANGVLGGFKVPHVGLWGPRTTPREPVAGSSEATGGACLSGKTWGGWKNAGFCQEKGRFDPGKTSKPRTHFFKTNPGNMMIQLDSTIFFLEKFGIEAC